MAMDKYLWILLAALLLASCSANDSEEQAGGSAVASAVSFDVTTDDAATRGVIANTQAFLTDGRQFRVWAFMKKGTDPEQEMTSDYNSSPLQAVDVTYIAYRNEWWTYANDGINPETYYWPRPEFAVNFYAIYPTEYEYNSTQILTFNTTDKTLNYTAPTDPDDAVDVMYAAYHGQRNGEEKPNKRKAAVLKFYHALTQVSFYGHLSSLLNSLGWHIDVNSITLCNVPSTGSMQLRTTDDPENENPSDVRFTPNTSTRTNYEFKMNPNLQRLTTYSTPTNTLTGKTLLTSPTDVAMLLPQELTAWNTSSQLSTTEGCYLAVKLRIWDTTSGSYILGTNADDGFVTVYAPFNCGVTGGWQSGQHYKYLLTFNGGYDVQGNPVVKDIEISASITPWTSQNVDGGNIYR